MANAWKPLDDANKGYQIALADNKIFAGHLHSIHLLKWQINEEIFFQSLLIAKLLLRLEADV